MLTRTLADNVFRAHGPTGVCNCVLRQSGAGGEDRQLRVRETRDLGMRDRARDRPPPPWTSSARSSKIMQGQGKRRDLDQAMKGRLLFATAQAKMLHAGAVIRLRLRIMNTESIRRPVR